MIYIYRSESRTHYSTQAPSALQQRARGLTIWRVSYRLIEEWDADRQRWALRLDAVGDHRYIYVREASESRYSLAWQDPLLDPRGAPATLDIFRITCGIDHMAAYPNTYYYNVEFYHDDMRWLPVKQVETLAENDENV